MGSTLCFGLFVMFCMPEGGKATTVVCPPIIEISPSLQKRTAAELKKLPSDSALREFAARSIEQRDVNRACLKAKNPQTAR